MDRRARRRRRSHDWRGRGASDTDHELGSVAEESVDADDRSDDAGARPKRGPRLPERVRVSTLRDLCAPSGGRASGCSRLKTVPVLYQWHCGSAQPSTGRTIIPSRRSQTPSHDDPVKRTASEDDRDASQDSARAASACRECAPLPLRIFISLDLPSSTPCRRPRASRGMPAASVVAS
jgi:hypothetical protein